MAGEKRRRFGNVRQRASGRWQARYLGPDGIERAAPTTFATEKQARDWLTVMESEIIQGSWMAPEAGEVKLAPYGRRWIAERKLAARTREGYEYLFGRLVEPQLGKLAIGAIKPATIRTWRRRLLGGGTPEPQAVKAYALLRAIFNTAVKEDEFIRQNPCRIKGYDTYHTPERPTATVAQVYALAGAVPLRFRALVLVAAFSGLRWGELAALRRHDLDLTAGTVRVPRKLAALKDRLEFGPPKSEAGVRTVALPKAAVDALRLHLDEFVEEGPGAVLFTGDRGSLLRSSNFNRATRWTRTVTEVGLPDGFHFHDLRHTGNTIAAASGASTRELMHRMGHASMRAALIYQHATSERDREIAKSMDRRIKKAGEKAAGKKGAKKKGK